SAGAKSHFRSGPALSLIRFSCLLCWSLSGLRRCEECMQCGLYCKLPAKPDFIAVGVPRRFLREGEPWLQSVGSGSRAATRDDWEAAFLKAPIWRFWLGAEHCGEAVIGALMPSTDGIGRYFPLTLVAKADDSAAIPPPEFASQDHWFSSAESFLLSALDEN